MASQDFEKILATTKTLAKKDFDALLDKLSEEYYHDQPTVSDANYDLLESIYENRYGKRTKIGAPVPNIIRTDRADVNSGAKIKLPFYMGGLDKVKDQHSLDLWIKKQKADTFCVQDKEDGISVCLDTRNQSDAKLYKRGDEKEGSDISFLLPYLNIPTGKFAIRGELVIPIRKFEDKYMEEYKNPRNLVSGLCNPYSKKIDASKIKDIHLIAYEIYDQSIIPSKQIEMLKSWGFETPTCIVLEKDEITAENMTIEIKTRKTRSLYEIDGVVIKTETPSKPQTVGNPDNMVAFKIQGDTAVATVLHIVWSISTYGIYKPTVIVEPTNLCGVTIQRATGFNARFIVDNGLGPGAQVIITRSGDVIPYILEVVKKVEPSLPDDPFEWNKSGVEIVLPQGVESDEQKISSMTFFFKHLGAKFLAEKTIQELYNGGMRDLGDLFNAKVNDIIKIQGFQKKGAERIVASIQKAINGVPLYRLMAASSIFPSLGEKRLKLILEQVNCEIPDLPYDELCEMGWFENLEESIQEIKGFKTLSSVFSNNLMKFHTWRKKYPQIKIIKEEVESDEDTQQQEDSVSLSGLSIVFTGWRASSMLEKQINKRGGKVCSAVSNLTDIVVSKTDKITVKIQDAIDRGIKVVTKEEFLKEYNLQE